MSEKPVMLKFTESDHSSLKSQASLNGVAFLSFLENLILEARNYPEIVSKATDAVLRGKKLKQNK